MQRQPFYQIPKTAWLHVKAQETSTQPEEIVRQWCLHEMIRAYGVCITDLRSEASAKVGSRNYRIDILIQRDGKPWIVVECKRREHTDHQKAMEQAISYADAQRIQAEFAVYTNGDVWDVRRRIRTGWVPVIDLPIIGGVTANCDLVDHLRVLRSIQPVLYNLDSPIKGTEAARLLSAMQRFFNGSHSWCYAQDQGLRDAADNLLRVFANPGLHLNYLFGKLIHAVSCLQAHAKNHGLTFHSIKIGPQSTLSNELRFAKAQWQDLAALSKNLQAADVPLIHLISALLDYGQTLPSSVRKYPPITSAIHTRLREYLDSTLLIHFGLGLPDVSDELLTSDLRDYCKDSWQNFDKQN